MDENASFGRLPSKARLVAFYAVLAAATTITAIAVFSAGTDEHGQPSVAGGYDLTAPNSCFGGPPKHARVEFPRTAPAQAQVAGASFDLEQSGRFVNLSNAQDTLNGKLKLGT